jgi:hypothetical protein
VLQKLKDSQHAAHVARPDKGGEMLIIDRFEGDFAVVETSDGFVNIPRIDMPSNIIEGDVLAISIDKKKSDARKKRINSMMHNLFKE